MAVPPSRMRPASSLPSRISPRAAPEGDRSHRQARRVDEEGPGTTAALLKAAALEVDGRTDEAEALYLRIADGARYNYERMEALEAAARIRMDRGDAAGASQLYDRLVALASDGSADKAIYQMRLAEAKARAQN